MQGHLHKESLLRARKKIAAANITTERPLKNPTTELEAGPRMSKSFSTEDMPEARRPPAKKSIPLVNFLVVMAGASGDVLMNLIHPTVILSHLLRLLSMKYLCAFKSCPPKRLHMSSRIANFIYMCTSIGMMNQPRRLCLLLLMAIIFLIYVVSPSLRGFNSQESVLCASEIEEYAVYNAVVKEKSLGGFIVICDRTSPGLGGKLWVGKTYLGRTFPLAEETTIEDFLSKNEQSYPLKSCFHVRALVALISEEELGEIFEGTFRWSEFHLRYPFSQGFTELSRVGFNSRMDQALVYIGNSRGSLWGSGNYVLLSKEDGRWIVQDMGFAWIS